MQGNFTRVNKIETIYGRSRVNVTEMNPARTFTFTGGFSYIASISFTRVNFTSHAKITRQCKLTLTETVAMIDSA